jgi:DNA-directed RNA polymerase subunit RPC12/RpoP
MGRARSLLVATVLGFIGIAGLVGLALWVHDAWLGAIAVFMVMNCWGGLQQARALLRLSKLPRRDGFTCPTCKSSPPVGEYWKCGNCGQSFDTFQTWATCPRCSAKFPATRCIDCGRQAALGEWAGSSIAPSSTLNADPQTNLLPK